MSGSLIPDLFRRAVDANGVAVPGALANFYLTGTVTRMPTFTTTALSVANANPVVADSGGLFPEIFLDPSVTYRRILTRADGSSLGLDDDPISGYGQTGGALQYSSETVAAAQNIPSAAILVQTLGLTTAGDGGAGFYERTSVASPGPGKFQSTDGQWWILVTNVVNPLQFGAVVGQADSTTYLQNAVNFAATAGVWVDFLGLPFNVSTVSFPSNSRSRNHNFKAIASSVDITPILIANVSNVLVVDPFVDGNRISQGSMTTAGGDGKRQGIAINGRVADITIIRPVIRRCATDGIRCDAGGATSSTDSDYLQVNVRIIDMDSQWNGRHGGSGMSQQNFFVSGASQNNGQNMAGYPSAPYTSGGNARTVSSSLGGNLYGYGWDQEDEGVLGGGFNGCTIALTNVLNNASGLAVSSDADPSVAGFVPRTGLVIRGAALNATDYVNGTLPLIVSQFDSYTGSLKTFVGVAISGVNVASNFMSFAGIENLSVQGTSSIHATQPLNNPVVIKNCSNYSLDVVSDTDIVPAIEIDALPFSIANLTQIEGSGWTLGNATLGLIGLLPGGQFRVGLSTTITPTGAGVGTFEAQMTGSVTITDVNGGFENQPLGAFVIGGAHVPGAAGGNAVNFGIVATTTDLILANIYMTIIPPGT